ncbi:MAG: hypothetical protein QW275_03070 [Candidatus Anstonellaceae archaeon]
MRDFALFAFFLLFFSLQVHSTPFNYTREQIIAEYHKVEPKLPKSAKMLIGNERVNAYVGGRVIGAEFRGGELYSLEMHPVKNPGIEVTISDAAVQAIREKKSGILPLIEKGEIRITTTNFLSSLKIEAAKRIYAVSGADEQITGKKKPSAAEAYNSAYIQRARIANSLLLS